MTRLMRVELRRLLHRRAVLVLLTVSVVVPVLVGVATVLDTRPPSASEVAMAQEQVERDLADGSYAEELAICVASPEDWGLGSGLSEAEVAQACEENTQPRLDWYLWSNTLDLSDERDQGSAVALTLILAIAMMVLGTTFTGHDWASGSVSNQLLFEPRRLRLWGAKAVVVTGVALLVGAVTLTSYWLALDAVAGSRDLPSGGALLLDCLQMGWRATGVLGAAALAGFALTMLFRSTVATLGILFGVALAGGLLLGVLGFEGRWNPALNASAVISDGLAYDKQVACSPAQVAEMGVGAWCTEPERISAAQGTGYLGSILVAGCAVSALSFRRRDVP
ncbi:hypothetical protein JK386_09335 [Nocardioides sp. zg-536]|uniref:Uncharacterized protein n=1 Tax=Nocardioides faecalis TaxID=2803858 RepID=A0A939BVM1_9ACTN|nr:hypothetical protein [Nocardioides faecalis]MBM9460106.1 hypothetical protein [Nocardioides faecalis]MBS4754205.1 hypothetical protein [Nocardioides faecalis]QVI60101.1 hypothetical protein KG111_07280 [Nocardioides faecalis]